MSVTPYILGYEPNVRFDVIASVGDVLDGAAYRMVGIPDGLGAFDNGDGTITVLMNHELRDTQGVARDHGAAGAFVSQWTLNKADLSVVTASDAIQTVQLWNDGTQAFELGSNVALNRLCSADLADVSAYYWVDDMGTVDVLDDVAYGTQDRIFMTGEEGGTEGREFGVVVTGAEAGTAYELAYTGLFAWENGLSSNFAQLKTINIGLDDGQNGQVYVYIGDKQTTGTAVDKAGLNNGNLYGIKVTGLTDGTIGGVVNGDESDAAAASGRFSLYNHGDVSAVTGADLDADSEANLVTSFMRPEDGHWDPTNANVFWFVTTAGFSGQSRLYKLTFDDITNPETGGTIEAVLDSNQLPINGTVGPRMMDNMTVNADGKIIIQEDPGNQSHLAKMFEYDPVTDTLTIIGESNPDLFITGAPGFLTQDEEHSGVIDVTSLLGYAGGSAYLLDVQSHSNLVDPELVQDGQFLAMYVDDVITTGTGAAETLNGSAAAETFNGKAGADIINAGSGDDTLFGANGDDTLNGGAGNDVLTGHAGDDVINGGAGSDTLRGAIGNDVLNGGLGKDLLVGGTGADTFVFGVDDSLVTARDRIQGFDSAEGDLIDLTALGVTFADLDVLTMASDLYAVAVDLDGNTGYEFVLMVQSNAALTSADFVL